MTEWVKIRHPRTGGEAKVPASSVGHHVGAGWLPAGQAETPAEAEPEPETPPEAEPRPAGNDQESE